MVRALFGLRLRDINFGFKAVRRSAWEKLQLRSRSPFVDAELFVQARYLGLRVKESPYALCNGTWGLPTSADWM